MTSPLQIHLAMLVLQAHLVPLWRLSRMVLQALALQCHGLTKALTELRMWQVEARLILQPCHRLMALMAEL